MADYSFHSLFAQTETSEALNVIGKFLTCKIVVKVKEWPHPVCESNLI